MIKSIKDIQVYMKAKEMAMEIFRTSSSFPKEEKYSMTDQIIRSSRSISANIREGYAKRKYHNVFIHHLVHAVGSSEETREWIEYAFECNYICKEDFVKLDKSYDKITAMLYKMINNWETYDKSVTDTSDVK
jgi:four helix bundle protein